MPYGARTTKGQGTRVVFSNHTAVEKCKCFEHNGLCQSQNSIKLTKAFVVSTY